MLYLTVWTERDVAMDEWGYLSTDEDELENILSEQQPVGGERKEGCVTITPSPEFATNVSPAHDHDTR